MPAIYILTNAYMPKIVKIGRTDKNGKEDSVEQRIKELFKTGVPVPFECFYAVDVGSAEAMKAIEKLSHEALDDYRVSADREFFEISPEKAKNILLIAEKMGGKDVTPKLEDIGYALEEIETVRRTNFKFPMLNIIPGEILQFKKDKSITCEVVDDSQVKFGDDIMSLTASSTKILKSMDVSWVASGTDMWCKDGETLYDLRLKAGK